ncbi:uncharacterized protein LOC133180439 [Saccostrea echinata]|uniref:uncharacterized protein LOC133180439 n=1 Tax=Saccostrea echinata TaxID=191078 RepID=UPI002A821FD2|nr:uncharacterized protein LOC133180439 [Saccostrea echinata]
MCGRESLSRRCVLVKQVPEELEEDCIYSIHGVEKFHRHNELSIGSGEVRWIVLLTSQDEAEKLMRDGHVTLDSDGQKLDLPVGGCPECIIPDEWVENTPTRLSAPLSFDDEMLQDSIGMKSIRCRERSKNLDDYVKVEKPISAEKPEEKESTDKYVPSFVIPAISSPYSQLNLSDSNNSHVYSSLQSQHPGTEEMEFTNITSTEETQTYTPMSPPANTDNFQPAQFSDEVTMNMSMTSKSRDDEDDPYHTINDVAVSSHLGHDEPPPLPQRLSRSESKEVSSSTYMKPASRSGSHYDQPQPVLHLKQVNEKQTSRINPQENSPGKFPVNSHSTASGADTLKTGSGDNGESPSVPQRLSRTQDSEVSSSTYIEPVSTGQVQSAPKTNTKPDIPQPGLKSEQSHSQASGRNSLEHTPSSGFSMNSEKDSNKILHNAESNIESMASYGKDPSQNQATSAVINEQRTPGGQAQQGLLDQREMHRDSGSPIVRHHEPGNQRTSNQESGGQRETNQTPGSQRVTGQGMENQTNRNRETEGPDAVYQNLEMFRRPDQGPNPGFMIAPTGQTNHMNPQNQHGAMPPGQTNGMMNPQNQHGAMPPGQTNGMMNPQNQHGAMPPGQTSD